MQHYKFAGKYLLGEGNRYLHLRAGTGDEEVADRWEVQVAAGTSVVQVQFVWEEILFAFEALLV